MCVEEIPTYLKKFVCDMYMSASNHDSSPPSCLSVRKIPFSPPKEMMAVFKRPIADRFSLDSSDTAHLAPPFNSTCDACGGCSWSQEHLTVSCFLVTLQGVFSAKGEVVTNLYTAYSHKHYECILHSVYQRHCSVEGCAGVIHFDG